MRIAWKVRVAGIALLARAEAGRPADDRGQLGGAFDGPRGDDGAGDRPGARLLPIVAQDPGDLGLLGRIQKFGGGQARSAHPHVERAVGLERKAALGAVELHRADADIERDGVDEADAALGQRPVHLREALLDQGAGAGPGRANVPPSIASGSRSKPITRPAPAASMARV